MSKLESDEVVLEKIPFNLRSIFEEDTGSVIEQVAAEQNIKMVDKEVKKLHTGA